MPVTKNITYAGTAASVGGDWSAPPRQGLAMLAAQFVCLPLFNSRLLCRGIAMPESPASISHGTGATQHVPLQMLPPVYLHAPLDPLSLYGQTWPRRSP